VPSLAEAIEHLDPALKLAVDVKAPWAVIPLLREVMRRGIESRVLVWCTSALAVRYALRVAPAVEVAYLKDSTSPAAKRAFLGRAVQLRAAAVSAHWLAIDADFVAAAHALDLRVYSYHGGYALTPAKLCSGLDGLITDYVREARQALAALQAS
jgi:hypothetical protein